MTAATDPTSIRVPADSTRVARWSSTEWLLVGAVVVGALLRVWDLGADPLSIDETYTVLAARLPIVDLVRHIDATDPHGPLAYLVLHPVAAFTTDLGALRLARVMLASALASIASLVVMAIWQRRYGVAGLVTTVIFALSPFQLIYGRQVRMYGLLALAGVTAAWCADRWLRSDGRRWAIVAGVAGLVAALSHGTGVLLLVCLLAIPALRRDRSAWEFRAANGLALSLFALLWGMHALRWSRGNAGLPPATPSWLSTVVNETFAPVPDQRWLVLAAMAAGGVLICRRRGPQARVWGWMFVAPILALYVASLNRGVLIPKSLMPFSWGVPLALGAVVGWLLARWKPAGVVALALLFLSLVPYVGSSLHRDEGNGAAMDALFLTLPGYDGVAVRADEWQANSLVRWYGGVGATRRVVPDGDQMGALTVYRSEGDSSSGRALFVTMLGGGAPAGAVPCGPPRLLGGALSMQCIEAPADAGAEGGASSP